MLDAHVSQLYEWLPWVAGDLEIVPKDAAARKSWLRETRAGTAERRGPRGAGQWYGSGKGRRRAACRSVRDLRYHSRPDEALIRKLFPFLPSWPRMAHT